jgi:4-hydroxy 2-oxovalerate aldolase
MNNKRIKILDSTLRDGGYTNEWEFGEKNIKKTIEKLKEANIELIECGFLSSKKETNSKKSVFQNFNRIKKIIPKEKGESLYLLMINYGDFELKNIPDCNKNLIDGIRVAFHKKDIKKATKFCKSLSQKGYLVFAQMMVTINYSDEEILEAVSNFNKINLESLYIVDSFGVMKKNDLVRIFYLIDNNLKKDISIGYHSHNNLQLAFSNAQRFIEISKKRDIIIDSTVFGIGRGAGNLNTELIIKYLNDLQGFKYEPYPILQIIDEVLNDFYVRNSWGYSLPHYLSANNNCHPNYATYLSDKKTLTVESISEILSNISEKKKNNFDKDYIEKIYINYQKRDIDDKQSITTLKKELKNEEIILLAPGLSLKNNLENIKGQAKRKKIQIISVNFIPKKIPIDYVFVSNNRRFQEFLENNQELEKYKKILTSNIKNKGENQYIINYIKLLNNLSYVRDNAGLMVLELLKKVGVKRVYLAGFDGYSSNQENYLRKEMNIVRRKEVEDKINKGMVKALKKFNKDIKIEFLTPSKYNFNSK